MSRARTQLAATCHHHLRNIMPVQLRSVCRTICVVIVIAQNHNRVRILHRFIHDPGFGGKFHDGMTCRIHDGDKATKNSKATRVEIPPPRWLFPMDMFMCLDQLRASCSAACSGRTALK